MTDSRKRMYINIHTHLDKVADNVLTVKNIFPGRLKEELPSDCFISVGLHPWYINSRNPESGLSVIAEYASHPEVIAIGETGLDKFRGPSPEIQEEVFLHHHDISQSVRKPLIIHCVRSYTDIIALRKKLKPSVPWIIHGFNSSLQTAMQLIRNDCLLSFGPAILREKSKSAAVLKDVPADCLFLETDETDCSIEEVYGKATEIRTTTIENLIKQIISNFNTYFSGVPDRI